MATIRHQRAEVFISNASYHVIVCDQDDGAVGAKGITCSGDTSFRDSSAAKPKKLE